MSQLGSALLAQLDADDLRALAEKMAEHMAPAEPIEAPHSEDELMTVSEAARRAQCHVETIRRAIRSQSLTACRVGSAWRVSADALTAWLQRPVVRRPVAAARVSTRRSSTKDGGYVPQAFAALRAQSTQRTR